MCKSLVGNLADRVSLLSIVNVLDVRCHITFFLDTFPHVEHDQEKLNIFHVLCVLYHLKTKNDDQQSFF